MEWCEYFGQSQTVVLYVGNIWRGKILANSWRIAKFLPSKCLSFTIWIACKSKFINILPSKVKKCVFANILSLQIFPAYSTSVMYHCFPGYISYVPQFEPLIWGVKVLHILYGVRIRFIRILPHGVRVMNLNTLIRVRPTTPTFITEALRLVANAQPFKGNVKVKITAYTAIT